VKSGQPIHVQSPFWPDRLICGRRTGARVKTATLAAAALLRADQLCQQCRRQLRWELRLEQIGRAPRPAGYQFEFPFLGDLSYG
jgi:hypothetical protein